MDSHILLRLPSLRSLRNGILTLIVTLTMDLSHGIIERKLSAFVNPGGRWRVTLRRCNDAPSPLTPHGVGHDRARHPAGSLDDHVSCHDCPTYLLDAEGGRRACRGGSGFDKRIQCVTPAEASSSRVTGPMLWIAHSAHAADILGDALPSTSHRTQDPLASEAERGE